MVAVWVGRWRVEWWVWHRRLEAGSGVAGVISGALGVKSDSAHLSLLGSNLRRFLVARLQVPQAVASRHRGPADRQQVRGAGHRVLLPLVGLFHGAFRRVCLLLHRPLWPMLVGLARCLSAIEVNIRWPHALLSSRPMCALAGRGAAAVWNRRHPVVRDGHGFVHPARDEPRGGRPHVKRHQGHRYNCRVVCVRVSWDGVDHVPHLQIHHVDLAGCVDARMLRRAVAHLSGRVACELLPTSGVEDLAELHVCHVVRGVAWRCCFRVGVDVVFAARFSAEVRRVARR